MRLKGARHKLILLKKDDNVNFSHRTIIRTTVDEYNSMLIWACNNIKYKMEYLPDPGTVERNSDNKLSIEFELWFENVMDAVNFKLKWQNNHD